MCVCVCVCVCARVLALMRVNDKKQTCKRLLIKMIYTDKTYAHLPLSPYLSVAWEGVQVLEDPPGQVQPQQQSPGVRLQHRIIHTVEYFEVSERVTEEERPLFLPDSRVWVPPHGQF